MRGARETSICGIAISKMQAPSLSYRARRFVSISGEVDNYARSPFEAAIWRNRWITRGCTLEIAQNKFWGFLGGIKYFVLSLYHCCGCVLYIISMQSMVRRRIRDTNLAESRQREISIDREYFAEFGKCKEWLECSQILPLQDITLAVFEAEK